MSYEYHKVKVTVLNSKCPKYKEGDTICFAGSCLDKEHSDNVCMVAVNVIHLFIQNGQRFKNRPYQCTGCDETVTFKIKNND